MDDNSSRSRQRVEEYVVTDEPHERYQMFNPWTQEELSHGIPILITIKGRKIVNKQITHYKIRCPECGTTARYGNGREPLCPDCGVVCAGKEKLREERMVRDAQAAGRYVDKSQ
jgi:acetone carboxylase gamma subunit